MSRLYLYISLYGDGHLVSTVAQDGQTKDRKRKDSHFKSGIKGPAKNNEYEIY